MKRNSACVDGVATRGPGMTSAPRVATLQAACASRKSDTGRGIRERALRGATISKHKPIPAAPRAALSLGREPAKTPGTRFNIIAGCRPALPLSVAQFQVPLHCSQASTALCWTGLVCPPVACLPLPTCTALIRDINNNVRALQKLPCMLILF